MYKDLISGRKLEAKGVQIPAYGVYWLMREKWDEKDTAVEHGEKSV